MRIYYQVFVEKKNSQVMQLGAENDFFLILQRIYKVCRYVR